MSELNRKWNELYTQFLCEGYPPREADQKARERAARLVNMQAAERRYMDRLYQMASVGMLGNGIAEDHYG